jgi:hypothetical protein
MEFVDYILKEKNSSDKTAAVAFKKMVRELVEEEGYSMDNIYNAETGLNWKALPRKTLASRRESAAPGYKGSKDRITLLVCASASGNHRLPILAVGKSKKLQCFKHVNMDSVPVKYMSQKMHGWTVHFLSIGFLMWP